MNFLSVMASPGMTQSLQKLVIADEPICRQVAGGAVSAVITLEPGHLYQIGPDIGFQGIPQMVARLSDSPSKVATVTNFNWAISAIGVLVIQATDTFKYLTVRSVGAPHRFSVTRLKIAEA